MEKTKKRHYDFIIGLSETDLKSEYIRNSGLSTDELLKCLEYIKNEENFYASEENKLQEAYTDLNNTSLDEYKTSFIKRNLSNENKLEKNDIFPKNAKYPWCDVNGSYKVIRDTSDINYLIWLYAIVINRKMITNYNNPIKYIIRSMNKFTGLFSKTLESGIDFYLEDEYTRLTKRARYVKIDPIRALDTIASGNITRIRNIGSTIKNLFSGSFSFKENIDSIKQNLYTAAIWSYTVGDDIMDILTERKGRDSEDDKGESFANFNRRLKDLVYEKQLNFNKQIKKTLFFEELENINEISLEALKVDGAKNINSISSKTDLSKEFILEFLRYYSDEQIKFSEEIKNENNESVLLDKCKSYVNDIFRALAGVQQISKSDNEKKFEEKIVNAFEKINNIELYPYKTLYDLLPEEVSNNVDIVYLNKKFDYDVYSKQELFDMSNKIVYDHIISLDKNIVKSQKSDNLFQDLIDYGKNASENVKKIIGEYSDNVQTYFPNLYIAFEYLKYGSTIYDIARNPIKYAFKKGITASFNYLMELFQKFLMYIEITDEMSVLGYINILKNILSSGFTKWFFFLSTILDNTISFIEEKDENERHVLENMFLLDTVIATERYNALYINNSLIKTIFKQQYFFKSSFDNINLTFNQELLNEFSIQGNVFKIRYKRVFSGMKIGTKLDMKRAFNNMINNSDDDSIMCYFRIAKEAKGDIEKNKKLYICLKEPSIMMFFYNLICQYKSPIEKYKSYPYNTSNPVWSESDINISEEGYAYYLDQKKIRMLTKYVTMVESGKEIEIFSPADGDMKEICSYKISPFRYGHSRKLDGINANIFMYECRSSRMDERVQDILRSKKVDFVKTLRMTYTNASGTMGKLNVKQLEKIIINPDTVNKERKYNIFEGGDKCVILKNNKKDYYNVLIIGDFHMINSRYAFVSSFDSNEFKNMIKNIGRYEITQVLNPKLLILHGGEDLIRDFSVNIEDIERNPSHFFSPEPVYDH